MHESATVNVGDFGVFDMDSGDAFMDFFVPADFSSITAAVVAIIPATTSGTANIDIASDYAASGQASGTHSESDTASTYNVVSGQIFEIDISGILTSLAAGDYVGIRVTDNTGGGNNARTLGLRFKYT